VHVLNDDQWNAFTIGGGKVFVYSGMFQPDIGVQTDDELAAVLAHEIAHVTARHVSEGQGQLVIAKLASKKLREDSYEAAFTTQQEDEADRYSVIYSALAGYDPKAGVAIWTRLHSTKGSYTGDMLYDHPLHDDRARNLQSYASLAEQYYTPGVANPQHASILTNNAVFSYRETQGPVAGEGGGTIALIETATSTYSKVLDARNEQYKRQIKQREQEQLAARRLLLQGLQISPAKGGSKGVFGTAVNVTNSEIQKAIVVIYYLKGKKVIHKEQMALTTLKVHERRQFGIPLRPIKYSSVSVRPTYVQLVGE
jgi:predicted Zn-dependent protease